MATFLSHDRSRIVIGTTTAERIPALILMGHGALFVGGAIYAWTNPSPGQITLGFALFLAVGLAEFGYALTWLLTVNSLVVDLDRQTYRVDRGAFRRETRIGPVTDFDRLRLWDLHYGKRNRGRRWAVEWVWRDPSRPPFRFTNWGRPRSFRVYPGTTDCAGFPHLPSLEEIAKSTGLPLALLEN